MKKTIQMEELVCPMCAQKIETALQKVPGVTSAKVMYNASKAKGDFTYERRNHSDLKQNFTSC